MPPWQQAFPFSGSPGGIEFPSFACRADISTNYGTASFKLVCGDVRSREDNVPKTAHYGTAGTIGALRCGPSSGQAEQCATDEGTRQSDLVVIVGQRRVVFDHQVCDLARQRFL